MTGLRASVRGGGGGGGGGYNQEGSYKDSLLFDLTVSKHGA